MPKLLALACLVLAPLALAENPPAHPAPVAPPAPTATTPPAPGKTLPADQLLNNMLKPAASAPKPLQPVKDPAAQDKTSGKAAVSPAAPAQTVMREGTFLVDRVGRLTRSADGQQIEFSFESDGAAMKDPPVILLPNLKLMAMETAATSSNRDLRFRITGMVTEYRGRNYILLEKVVVIPDATQQF